jgi:hypothetical protein
MVVLLCP